MCVHRHCKFVLLKELIILLLNLDINYFKDKLKRVSYMMWQNSKLSWDDFYKVLN